MTAKIRNVLAALMISAFAFTTSAALAQDVKVPETAADHETLAKKYKDEAEQHRKTAEEHKKMAEAYAKANPDPAAKGGRKNPWNAKMEKHCQTLAKGATKLAADADKAAEFHTLRAKELAGK
jgi:hypothetical protein